MKIREIICEAVVLNKDINKKNKEKKYSFYKEKRTVIDKNTYLNLKIIFDGSEKKIIEIRMKSTEMILII